MDMLILIALIGFLCLSGIVGLFLLAILNGERTKRLLTLEFKLNAIEKYLELLNSDISMDMQMPMMGTIPGMITGGTVEDIITQMKENGQIDSNASDDEALQKFFENLLNGHGQQPPKDAEDEEDEEGDEEGWKKGKK